MMATQLSRVATRAGTTIPLAATATCALAAQRPKQQKQQRRLSSSKANSSSSSSSSCPASSDAAQRSGAASGGSGAGRRAGKKDKKEAAAAAAAAAAGNGSEVFGKLPSVPSTHHMHPSDITLSSFFSMHRPLSLTATIPPSTDIAAFNKIFEPSTSNNNQHSPQDVIYTLSSSINSLDPTPQDPSDLHWEIIQESPSNASSSASETKHLDGAPRAKTLEELVAQFKPFVAPPPPNPITATSPSKQPKLKTQQQQQQQKPKQKSYKATIFVTEETSATGEKTYTAEATPMLPVREPISRTPFLDRMRRRQIQDKNKQDGGVVMGEEKVDGEIMQAISVKRQRKLKMKKHKYKKLMKRTRNIRRRLDRN